MNNQRFVTSMLAVLLLGAPAIAQTGGQSAADLLQKGIHAQETVGDVDSAIQIFRQVAGSPAANKTLAAQAQYQLVVCMLQKGDRTAARKELDLLARNFPGDGDLLAKARKLVPGGDTYLPAPWGEYEGNQLNIKRDGTFTGEYLYYSVDPASPDAFRAANPQAVILRWELNTTTTKRSASVQVDRETFQPMDKPILGSNDALGDAGAAVLAGPAIDLEQSVFLLRRLPLAPGFKSSLTTQPFTLASKVRGPVEFSVTGIEAVQTVAGKFNCYKVAMPAIKQTFWIGVDGARPLVKLQAGNLEAELVKVWTTNVMDTMLGFAIAGGWRNAPDGKSNFFPRSGPGPESEANLANPENRQQDVTLTVRKQYTPKAEIAQALRKDLDDRPNWTTETERLMPESVETLEIGGHQALRCLVESKKEKGVLRTVYFIWIRSESTAVRLVGSAWQYEFAVFRWKFDHLLETIKVP